MPRAERRASRARLTPTAVYTFRATGDVLNLLARGVFVREDGQVVTIHWQFVKGEGGSVFPQFIGHHAVGRGWRVRIAHWLLGLR